MQGTKPRTSALELIHVHTENPTFKIALDHEKNVTLSNPEGIILYSVPRKIFFEILMNLCQISFSCDPLYDLPEDE